MGKKYYILAGNYHLKYVYSVDIQARNRKPCFFKDKYFWQFNDKNMAVTGSSPMQVGEFWLHCPKEIHDPFKKAGSTGGSSSLSNQNYVEMIFLFIMLLSA